MGDDENCTLLLNNARAGRGLWIGLFAGPETKEALPDALRPHWPARPHVTLTHLGKAVPDRTVRLAYLSVQRTGAVTVTGKVTGVGVFWRKKESVTVALVNSASMFMLRGDILEKLRNHEIPLDTYFGFIPHITLENTDNSARWKMLNLTGEIPLSFRLGIVCGDAEVIL